MMTGWTERELDGLTGRRMTRWIDRRMTGWIDRRMTGWTGRRMTGWTDTRTHGFRTFSCFGSHIWNSLPQDLRHCSTLSSFKAKLKTFLFSQYFHPN